ncbi:MAG: hypothetical protein FJ095_01135 [Deltaproteobacteria bacterium]|nr:hypothetical protein [Deltaproteobacteria bacterium]
MPRVLRVLVLGLLSVPLWHCDSGATGIDACRAIELEKCELVRGCVGVTIATDADVEACKLYYRDQCLNGIADAADPNSAQVDGCLAALAAAAACKVEPLSSCVAAPELAAGVDATKTTGCEAMLATESLEACDFLRPPPASSSSASSSSASSSSASSSSASSSSASSSSSSSTTGSG